MSAIGDYLKNVPAPQRAILERIREIAKTIAPDAQESISYGVPTLKCNGAPLIYFAAFKNHMSIFPASDAMVAKLGSELAQYRVSKGTLRFTEDKPIPEPLIKKVVKYRLASIT